MTIDLFCTVYNEAFLLPHMVEFYKARIPVRFHIYDNGSTDNTKEIAKELGCFVYDRDTKGEIRDDLLLEWKNTVWKGATSDWVMVVDCDEWVDIRPEHLKGTSIVSTETYDMIGLEGQNPLEIKDGIRVPMSDKVVAWDKAMIKEINYSVGAHTAAPQGYVVWSHNKPKMYHMRYLGPEYLVNKYKDYANRLSDINKKSGWGWHYNKKIEELQAEYDQMLVQKKPVKDEQ